MKLLNKQPADIVPVVFIVTGIVSKNQKIYKKIFRKALFFAITGHNSGNVYPSGYLFMII